MRLGMTAPVLVAKFWKTSSADRMAALHLFAFHQSMDLIYEGFWDLNWRGFDYDPSDKTSPVIVPYVVAYPVDLEEAWMAACRPPKGTWCHLKLKLDKSQYINPDVRVCQ